MMLVILHYSRHHYYSTFLFQEIHLPREPGVIAGAVDVGYTYL